MLFKLQGSRGEKNVGSHTAVDGHTYKSGDIIESGWDLRKKWPNKFVLLPEPSFQHPIEVETKKVSVSKKISPSLKDVTAKYPKAEDLGWKILQEGPNQFEIVNANKPDEIIAGPFSRVELVDYIQEFSE